MNTVIYIFNENGIIIPSELENFCLYFESKTSFGFTKQNKIDSDSTVFKKISKKELDYIIYDYGYVMKIEGNIKNAIFLLKELDEIIGNNISFYISPIQRISNSKESKFPRKASVKEIAKFLDKQFNNIEYTLALDELS